MTDSQSNRERKAEELEDLAEGLRAEDLNDEETNRLINMLESNVEGMRPVDKYSFMISQKSLDTVIKSAFESFELLQEAIECIDKDNFRNEWYCQFSNRKNHKSLKLKSLKSSLIYAQKSAFNALDFVLNKKGYSYVLTKMPNNFNDNNFYFRVNNK